MPVYSVRTRVIDLFIGRLRRVCSEWLTVWHSSSKLLKIIGRRRLRYHRGPWFMSLYCDILFGVRTAWSSTLLCRTFFTQAPCNVYRPLFRYSTIRFRSNIIQRSERLPISLRITRTSKLIRSAIVVPISCHMQSPIKFAPPVGDTWR